MKALKYITQVISAFIYTWIYNYIMHLAICIPALWIISMSFWKMLIVSILLVGIIEALIYLLMLVGLRPYAWIIRNNKVSFVISMVLCIFYTLYNMVVLWRTLLDFGTLGVIAAITLSIFLLQFCCVTIYGLVGIKSDNANLQN